MQKQQFRFEGLLFFFGDFGCGMRDTGCGRRDAGYGMRDTGYGMRDTGCGIRDMGWIVNNFPVIRYYLFISA